MMMHGTMNVKNVVYSLEVQHVQDGNAILTGKQIIPTAALTTR
jgi:hypothetical protein